MAVRDVIGHKIPAPSITVITSGLKTNYNCMEQRTIHLFSVGVHLLVAFAVSFPGRVGSGGEKTAGIHCLRMREHSQTWEFVFVCKWSVKLKRIRPIHFRITSEKALSVRLRCRETCHTVRNLLHKCPEFRFDCLDFAYAGTAGKPSPLSTDTADMRSNFNTQTRTPIFIQSYITEESSGILGSPF